MGSNVVCNPLAEVAKPKITAITINPTTIKKIAKAVFSNLTRAGDDGNLVSEDCEA